MEECSQRQVRKKWERLLKASRDFDPSFAPNDIGGFRKGDRLLDDVLGWFSGAGLANPFISCSLRIFPDMMRIFTVVLDGLRDKLSTAFACRSSVSATNRPQAKVYCGA